MLDACQALYEKHKLITYPRSDSRHLPKDHYKQREQVCAAIGNNDKQLSPAVTKADLSLKSRAWNDGKVDAHHAIIPTPKSSGSAGLSGHEEKVYHLIARQYLMQFYPAAVYAEAELVFDIAGGVFVAKGKQMLFAGWRALLGKVQSQNSDDDVASKVPPLNKGEVRICREGEIKHRMTEPPKHFTEATLLQAMTGIARFVEDKELKKNTKRYGWSRNRSDSCGYFRYII